ncbi:MAG: hypothetical protein ACE5QV_07540 [Fidelibacterota bacterium]
MIIQHSTGLKSFLILFLFISPLLSIHIFPQEVNLDLNLLNESTLIEDVRPLTAAMGLFAGGVRGIGSIDREMGSFNIGLFEIRMFILKGSKRGPFKGSSSFSLPFFQVNLAIFSNIEISGRFSAASLGGEHLILSGAVLKYAFSRRVSGFNPLFQIGIQDISGPEDFRIKNLDFYIIALKDFNYLSTGFAVGTELSSLKLSLERGGKISSDRFEKVDASSIRLWIGVSKRMSRYISLEAGINFGRIVSAVNLGIAFNF